MTRTGIALGPGLARPGHAHVWAIRLLRGYVPAEVLSRHLTHRERAVARAYGDAANRMEYLATRYAVRKLVACYANVAARAIVLSRNIQGQPLLKRPRARNGSILSLAISHCSGAIALAFARRARVGIDIDTIARPPAVWRALRRHFLPAEQDLVLPRHMLECWTRKEALLKALGVGLCGLSRLPPLPGRADTVRVGRTRWRVESLPEFADCALAYAIEGGSARVTLFNLGSLNALKRIC